MELATYISLLLLGISILVWGANKFVDHASVIARHLGISDLVIGLTLISFGTSGPEIFVGISGVLYGNEEIALGTLIGSNISNIALIFGVSCLYLTKSSKTQLWHLMPFGLSILLLGLTLRDGAISFNEGIGFVAIFMLFMIILLKTAGLAEKDSNVTGKLSMSLIWSFIGLIALISGANITVIYAEATALFLGIPALIIGLTLVALGTSLPEFAASIVALRKGKHQMVVGNIIGSNVFNLVFVIPIIGFFGSVELSPIVMQRDFYVLAGLSLVFVLLAVALTKMQFKKSMFTVSGVVLVSGYILYISTLSGII